MAKTKKVKYKFRIIPKERRRKYKNTKSQKFVLGLLVVFLLVTAGYVFIKSDYFLIDNIHIEGINKLSQADIEAAGGIRVGTNIFDYNTSEAEDAIKKLNLVESVDIVRDCPSDVYIYVRERSNALAVLINSEYWYIDKNGVILKKESSITEMDVIIISFADPIENIELQVGTSFDFSIDPRFGIVKNVYNFALDNDLVDHISEIYISESGINYLYTAKSNVVKFYTYSAFEQNKDFVKDFIIYEDRHIMAEVVEGSRPVYKVIEIK